MKRKILILVLLFSLFVVVGCSNTSDNKENKEVRNDVIVNEDSQEIDETSVSESKKVELK